MRVVIAATQKVDVVCRDEPNAKVLRDLRQNGVAPLLFLHAVIVHFHEEIFRAENIAILGGRLLGDVDLVRLNGGIDFAGETTAQPDQSFRVRREKFLVDPRPIVKAFEMCR